MNLVLKQKVAIFGCALATLKAKQFNYGDCFVTNSNPWCCKRTKRKGFTQQSEHD